MHGNYLKRGYVTPENIFGTAIYFLVSLFFFNSRAGTAHHFPVTYQLNMCPKNVNEVRLEQMTLETRTWVT